MWFQNSVYGDISRVLGSYHFLLGGLVGRLFVLGTRIFSGGQRGGTIFFSGPRGRGARVFWASKRGAKIFFHNFFAPSPQLVVSGDVLSPWEDQNFFAGPKGGTKIFHRKQGGTKFFYVCKGGSDQKTLLTRHHGQTPPLPVKNDSSLIAGMARQDAATECHYFYFFYGLILHHLIESVVHILSKRI